MEEPLAIDFANTRPAPADFVDGLGDLGRLVDWLESAAARGGTTCPSPTTPTSLPERRILFEEAHRLRTAIDDLLESIASGEPVGEASLRAINRILEQGAVRYRLERHDPARNGVRSATETHGTRPTSSLVPIALDAVRVATTTDRKRLRRCAAKDCPRWFIDTSKGGQRRWCSMATCGNRNKAARFRNRQR